MSLTEDVKTGHNQVIELRAELQKAIIGQPELIFALIAGVLTGGPIALTGVPGLAKTHASKALSGALDCTYRRVQVMADLLPSDFTGGRVFNPATAEWTFEPGPLFAELVHLDELTRAGGRALSGLMEAMEEHQVTDAGIRYPLPAGQLIISTYNDAEHAGTEELPDAINDRHVLQAVINRPTHDEEVRIAAGDYFEPGQLTSVLTMKDVQQLQHLAREVASATDSAVVEYAVSLVRKTMNTEVFERAAGVRASRDLIRVAACKAIIDERLDITINDIQYVALMVLRHRVLRQIGYPKSVNKSIEELF